MRAFDPKAYGRTRNHLDGAVSRLSPYIRHGVLPLAQVRDRVLAGVEKPGQASKFVFELAWRDYWQRVYAEIGEGVWDDREAYKTGWAADEYARDLPDDIPEGETGLVCIDSFAEELAETGYLHNRARMYVAAYVMHWRRVAWQAGAAWFLLHLLDGDPASNNLSWQWVASTFGGKPYIWNRDNLEKHSDGRFCSLCPKASERDGGCPFEGSYAAIAARLFPHRGEAA
jgi:deoxyribodipyrimidine photo-lyase